MPDSHYGTCEQFGNGEFSGRNDLYQKNSTSFAAGKTYEISVKDKIVIITEVN